MCDDSVDASQGHAGRRAGCKAPCCSASEELLAGKFSRLSSPSSAAPSSSKSIVPKPIPLTALAQFSAAEHGIVNFQNGTSMAKEALKLLKIQQRGTQDLYKTAVFFPTAPSSKAKITDEDRCERSSLAVASSYICDGNYRCTSGDCMKAFQSSDVLAQRMQAMRSRSASKQNMREFLEANLNKCYNRSDETWGKLTVHLDAVTSTQVCPAAFALLVGSTSSLLQQAASAVKSPDYSPEAARTVLTAVERNERRGMDYSLLRAYVAQLLDKHEANPAPGAHQPGRITHINKQTWKQKWANCELYFKNAQGGTPGSQTLLKKAWKQEKNLKEKQACSHSKCATCSKISARLQEIVGVNTSAAREAREFMTRAALEHDEQHLGSRMELDQAGLQAIVDPHHIWAIVADAATQRNFLLPKFGFRTPKDLAGRPFWSYKLMATYAYGYGFTPFLVHDSQKMGANLTWTVIWLTLCAMRDKYGYWPSVLHLTLDNTTGENKNETLIAVCAWLVSSGKVKQVRILFLPVGHTHIIIDHIFGTITVALRRQELLVPFDLARCIDSVVASNPQYMGRPVKFLHCLWDFKAWAQSELKIDSRIERLFGGNVQDEDGTYNGMYDFQLKGSPAGTGFAVLQYREHCSHPWLPKESIGAQTIAQLPTRPPKLQQIKPYAQWGMCGTFHVRDTITSALNYARTVISTGGHGTVKMMWDRHFKDVPSSIELLSVELQLKFDHFTNDDVLRLTASDSTGQTDAPADEDDQAAKDLRYEAWKRDNVCIRTAPLAIDPVVSSAQSKTEFERAKAALQAALRVGKGPSIVSGSPIFLGDFVLARWTESSGVSLCNIQAIQGQVSPYSATLIATAVLYHHKPNAEVSGFFGTFTQDTVLVGGKRQQLRKQLTRSNVVVFNVDLMKSKHISLATLRVLEMAQPEAYPMPAQNKIPETHLDMKSKDKSTAERKQRPAATRERKASSRFERVTDSSDEESASGESEGEEEGEEGDDDELGDQDEKSEDEDADEEADVDMSPECGEEQAAPSNVPSNVPSAVPSAVPLLCLVVPKPAPDTVVALNMKDDPDFVHMKYPVGLAFVTQVDEPSNGIKLRWFALPAAQLTRANRKPRDFKYGNKFLTFHKEWDMHNWWPKSKGKPSIEDVMKHWLIQDASSDWLLPVQIPQPEPDKVKANDQFKIDMEFVKQSIIPACNQVGCIHN